ncbi:unnamed protein product [Prorocentrum cordatum]|uniref:Beta-galactosidase n=1 Tax=Prorocentrum cordatum TaxID=2364126 RepID=A0ABN9RRT4_9DINO|nr:unnamed protein product [Polarella glacialis]
MSMRYRVLPLAWLLEPASAVQMAWGEVERWRGGARPGLALDLQPTRALPEEETTRMRADPLAIRTQGTFSACGVSWDNYEPIRWNRTDGLTHFAACASASGDPSIIGVCHTGGVGHDSWQDCADVPAARCDGLVGPDQSPAKLLFVSCDGVDDPRLAVLGSTTPSPAPSPAPTTAPSREPRTFESSASSGQEALALGEGPHVTNLNGDSFDIGTPSSDYTLLRVPYDEEGPELLRLSASMDADGVRACSLYVKEVSLSGSLLAHQTVRVRPSAHTAGGSDQAGNKARANFSLRVGSSSWRDLWHDGVGAEVPEARVGLLTARLVWRKGPGQLERRGAEPGAPGGGGQGRAPGGAHPVAGLAPGPEPRGGRPRHTGAPAGRGRPRHRGAQRVAGAA